LECRIEKKGRVTACFCPAIAVPHQDLTAQAKPQAGIDDLKGKFRRPTRDIPGVVSK
jgi:hypothetical protein